MFYKIVLLFYLFLLIYDLIQKIKIPVKKVEPRKQNQDIFQHPLLVEAGIKRPLEECEIEEVEDVPLVWQVKYNERVDDYVTIKIEENDLLEIQTRNV